ncbi:MAG: hypothetical protein GY874_05895, partial [Desulfobacteraceae bacterium]|nr:hypothetical protein [Desulfobacteraceae bacterium]
MTIYHKFQDQKDNLFGRDKDIEFLMDRIKEKGLTAVEGRPKMGKTRLLEQVGWQLENQEQYLVGYHEAKGESDDHLLRTVQDLYRRWLCSASLYRQAESIFKRHKDVLAIGVGRLFGAIFKDVAKIGGNFVQESFKILEEADKDLKDGGISLPTLDYESVFALTKLVYEESNKKKVILILDGFEKSPNIQKIVNTLGVFLTHSSNWCPCHILIGIRNPELHNPDSEHAYDLVSDLTKSSALALLMQLSLMNLEDSAEEKRMLTYIREICPAAAKIKDEKLKNIVGGFPGVIGRIKELSSGISISIENENDLEKLAEEARKYLYREFDKLLPNLKGDLLTLAVRLAVFHRLSEASWPVFRETICMQIDLYLWEDLKQDNTLEQLKFPSYGHDTRYEAAFSYFKSKRVDKVKGELEKILYQLAKQINSVDDRSRPFAASLANLESRAKELGLSLFYQKLCQSAQSLFLPLELNQLKHAITVCRTESPGAHWLLIQALYNRGAAKGAEGDFQEAIKDYTAVIDMKDAPPDLKAKALVNRGAAKDAEGDFQEEIKDYTAVIDMKDAPPDLKANALYNRGAAKGAEGDFQEEIKDYTAVIDMKDAPAD